MKDFKINNLDKTDTLTLRMTDGYGIVESYRCENKCPYDRSKLIKTGTEFGCHDGEWTDVDRFTCENNCLIQYRDMRKTNGYDL